MPTISKTKFLNGLQCYKLLWYAFNQKEDFPVPDTTQMAIFEQGHLVGEYAKKLFPDGIEVAKKIVEFDQVLSASLEAYSQRKPMFEAAFQHDGAYARADILEPISDSKWDIIEVKSSTVVKKHHYQDVAFQKYVFEGAGININRCYLLHLNKNYVRKGEINPRSLFLKTDVTDEVNKLTKSISMKLRQMFMIIKQSRAPEILIGPQCKNPYDCPLMNICWKFLPKNNVMELYHGGKKSYQLVEKGIHSIADIPDDFNLTDSQKIQVKTVRDKKPHIDKERIRTFLSSLKYPIYFLDFETFGTAIPQIDNSRPYQQIPFQYSLHILSSLKGKPSHHSFLAEGTSDPRPEILKGLRKLLGTKGTILTFNKTFENRMLREMSRDYTEYRKWFEKIKPRIADLIVPFRSFAYYHPDQDGSASLKSVLPAVTGKDYSRLNIRDGGTASMEFYRVTYETATKEERGQVRKDLLIYCGLDTGGMIDILRVLNKLSK